MTLTAFMRERVENLKKEHRFGTAHVCNSTLNRILRFTKGQEMAFEDVTTEWLGFFEQELLNDGLLTNTLSTYARSLRATYNQAVYQGFAKETSHLFKHQCTKIVNGPSRALTEEMLQSIIHQPDSPLAQETERARLFFVLLILLRGLAFVDLVYLRRCDLVNGVIRIQRHKTGSPLVISVETLAMTIINYLADPNPDSLYLFPFLSGVKEPSFSMGEASQAILVSPVYQRYQSSLRTFNRHLELLPSLLGINAKLSSYTPRHSWATIAKYHKVDLKLISNAMGHSSVQVTEKYLKSFDEDVIRKVNQQIISYILPRSGEISSCLLKNG